MIDINILFVTTCYPPVNVSGSIRALYYTNYLVKLGHNVSVLTIDFPEQFSSYDETLAQRIDGRVSVYREGLGNIYNKLYKRKSEISKQSINTKESTKKSLKQKVRNCIKENMAIPDSYMIWRKKAYKKGIDIIKTKDIDIIFSMHETPSSHLVAYDLKKKFKDIRWIAYWSDPWTFDPIRSEYPILRKKIEKSMERKVVKLADKNLFTTNECKNLYINKFGLKQEDTDIVYRGYDENLYNNVLKLNKPDEIKLEKINIIHAGEIFTKLRDINPLIKAIRNIKSDNYELYKKLNIILLGGIDDINIIDRIDDLEVITILPRKSFDEALRYIYYSDVLLLFGNKNSNQMPGKVYDYLGTDKVIFTILGDAYDPLNAFMNEVDRGPICENTDLNIKNEIIQLIYKFDKNQVNIEWKNKSDKFEWGNVVNDLVYKIN